MLYGIIDIGSNTIRLNLYDIDHANAQLISSKKINAQLILDIENQRLSDAGMRKLTLALLKLQMQMPGSLKDNIAVFSTASLRNIQNANTVCALVKEHTGWQIDMLSGEEEAFYGFSGAMLDIKMEDGIFLDLGAGSSEIAIFHDHKIQQAKSLPLGSLYMRKAFVAKQFPDEKEAQAIKQHVKEACQIFAMKQIPHMCAIGGTIRAIQTLLYNTKILPEQQSIYTYDMLQALLAKLQQDPQILNQIPKRKDTILPGLYILIAIMEYFSTMDMVISRYSIREGYLYNRCMQQNIQQPME